MANKQISYTTRDFQNIRNELINFTIQLIKQRKERDITIMPKYYYMSSFFTLNYLALSPALYIPRFQLMMLEVRLLPGLNVTLHLSVKLITIVVSVDGQRI